MKKSILKIGVLVMMALCALPALAQLNGTGYYRFRNADRTGDYIQYANNMFNFTVVIDNAAGGFGNLTNEADPGRDRAVLCATRYMQTDIKLIEDPDCIDASTIIYAKKRTTSATNYEYDLISETVSLVNLLTGSVSHPNGTGHPVANFQNIYAHIEANSGSGANTLYTAYIKLEGTITVTFIIPVTQEASLGDRYFLDKNGIIDLDDNASAQNAKWYIEPVTHFNVFPEVELNGKYYTTIKVPFAFTLSNNVEKAYAITANTNGVLAYTEIATTGGTVPAGTPVLLECASPNAADCQLIPTGAALTDNSVGYTGTNLLDGTYFANTDGLQYYDTPSGTNAGNFNADNYEPTSGKYVIGCDENGKLGFVPATGTAMPANKAWLTSAGLFPAAATPTFSPAAGTYTEALSVSINSEDGDAIYYTTDGSTPTTASTLYTGPIEVSETTTIKAIAMKEGLFNNSDVATAEYVIESSVTHYKPGDVNHDNKVDIDDVTMLIDSVLGKPSGICEVCADLDGNSKVDIDDVTAAITIVLTGSY